MTTGNNLWSPKGVAYKVFIQGSWVSLGELSCLGETETLPLLLHNFAGGTNQLA